MHYFEMRGFDRLADVEEEFSEEEFGISHTFNQSEKINGQWRYEIATVFYKNEYTGVFCHRMYIIDRTLNGVEEDFEESMKENYPLLYKIDYLNRLFPTTVDE